MNFSKKNKRYNSKILLVLTNNPLTRHTYKRLGVNTTYKGWRIVYWNVLPLINRKLDNIYSNKGNRLKKDKNFIKINSLSNLIEEYKKIPDKFFYTNLTGYTTVSTSLLDRILNFSGGTKVSMEYGQQLQFKIKFFKALKHSIIYHKFFLILKILIFFYDKIKVFICSKILQAQPNIIFTGNLKTYLDFKRNYKNKKIFKINSPEFDLFLESKNKQSANNNILFIDQAVGESFDTQLYYYKNPNVKFDNYWNSIDKLCDFITKKFPNNKFFIVAHHRRNVFDIPIRKKFTFDKTCHLIKNSRLVLCHNSLASHLAVLFRKPIVFINMDFLQYSEYYAYLLINNLSKELGAQVINIDKNFKINKKVFKILKSAKVNKKKYEKYEKYYISFPGLKCYGSYKTILKYLDNVRTN